MSDKAEEGEEVEEISVLKMPEKLKRILRAVPGYEVRTLREVFSPYLAQTDDHLLMDPRTPPDCQLAMTAYLLKKQELLQEVLAADEQHRLVIGAAAQECPAYGRGRR